MDDSPRTALVLCGGGSPGAAEIGLYQALCELGVRMDRSRASAPPDDASHAHRYSSG